MERALADVFESQREMLLAIANPASQQAAGPIIAGLTAEIDAARAWLDHRPNIKVFPARYEAILNAPEAPCADISRFLGDNLNVAAMVAAVDPSLHRRHAASHL
jgi:hypothetical protein